MGYEPIVYVPDVLNHLMMQYESLPLCCAVGNALGTDDRDAVM
jgi:hypothetical protein